MIFQLYIPNKYKSLLSFNDILVTFLIMYYTTIFMFCILKKKPNDVIKEVPIKIIKETRIEIIKEVIKEIPIEVIKEVYIEVIKEVPVEVIKEVPVEVIKEVYIEVIKEVPVEVIKEVPVEVIKEVIQQVESIQYFKEYEKIKELINEIDKIYINNTEINNIKKYYKEHYGNAINNYINPSSYVIYCIMIELLDKENDIKDKRKYQNKYENDIKNYINPNSYIINKFMIELLDKEIDIKDKLKKETILIAKKANFLDNEILKDFYTKYENNFNKILNSI